MSRSTSHAAVLGALTLVVLGCGADDGGSPDARPRPDAEDHDAAPAELCIQMTDAECGYEPEPVTPSDISLADQLELAQRFNPSVVYTGDAIWAVSFDILLTQAGPPPVLHRAEHDGRVNFSYRTDLTTIENALPDPQPADLRTVNLTDLPTTAPGGRGYVYFLDFPGTNTGNDFDEETWSAAWTSIQGNDPTAAPFPPFTYAHLFWLDKADRLLVVQYFFFYPYDKFPNNHEGDWEHVNIVLRYPEGGAPSLAGAHFSYHGRQLGVLAENLYRVGDDTDGDHVVVFVGGEACLNYVDECYCGDTSGATFPYPGFYDIAYWEIVDGYEGRPGRAVPHDDFTVSLLPRIEDVDFDENPELSWYALPLIAGEPVTVANHAAVVSTNNHRAPVTAGPEHGEFEIGIKEWDFALENGHAAEFVVPSGWELSNEPPSSVFSTLPTNDNCTPL